MGSNESEAGGYARFTAQYHFLEAGMAGCIGPAPRGAAVYEVERVGEVEPDHHDARYMPGTSFEAACAVILRGVCAVGVKG
jgi:hypothetical protein